MPDVADDVRHFAFAVPISAEQSARIATLRLSANGHQSVVRLPTSAASSSSANRVRVQPVQAVASVAKIGPSRVSVRWDAKAYPLVVVRDAVTGTILSLARGGEANVATSGGDVALEFSDGIHNVSSMGGGAPRFPVGSVNGLSRR